ncbi:MAG: glycosyltransferase [Candidatus Pacearchaeota archaeon]
MKDNKPEVDCIIVSHNNQDILSVCLDSIKSQSYTSYNAYLLDNDSTDRTAEFIRKSYPKVKFFDFPKKGPSEKRNIGMSMSNSKYIVVMDSDAALTKDWLKKAVNYMESHKDVGLCTGKLLTKEESIDATGGIFAKNSGATDRGHGEKDVGQYNTFKRVAYLKSATLIIRREMIDSIGVFDPDYFYGSEDTDLGIRANICGWKVIYNPELVSYHLGHNTMKKKPKKQETFRGYRNVLLTYFKNFQLKTIITYSPILLITFIYWIVSKKYRIEILKAYLVTLFNLRDLLKKRKIVQSKRKISDKELFDIVDFPLFIRNYNKKKNKYLDFIKNVKTNKIKSLVFFITTRCNSQCKHCFYWKDLNKSKDLSIKDIEKLLSNFYDVNSILLSGGEPFIREDFPEVIDTIIKYTNPHLISIPTNGLLGDKILKNMNEVLQKYPNVNFAIDCSLDGIESRHDYLRGVKGNFRKTIALIKELKDLKKKHHNFISIATNTVITKENIESLPELINLVKSLDIDDHFFDLIRGEHKGLLTLPTIKELKNVNALRYKTRKYYNSKRHKNRIKKIYANLRDRHVIITQIDVLEGKKWTFKCTAGVNSLILESDGSLRICELQPKIGNLMENSPETLLKSEQAKKLFKSIENHACDCTHICNVSSSMNNSFWDIIFNRIFIDSIKKRKYFD